MLTFRSTVMLAPMKMRIRQIRDSKGMSQAELAHQADIRIATLSEIENGKGNPRLSTLTGIAKALDVNVLDLFSEEGDEPSIFDLAHRISGLDQKTKDAVSVIVLNALSRPE